MPRLNRRGVILGTGAALVAGATAGVAVELTGSGTDGKAGFWRLPTGPPDPEQWYIRLIPGGDGVIYGVQANGSLCWMRHLDWRTGGPAWANNGVPRVIGEGWLRYRWVLAAADGQLFGITADGAVTWHRYELTDPATGDGNWIARSGELISKSLGSYHRFFGGWEGVIYGVTPKWTISRFRYMAGNGSGGTKAWANDGKPNEIGDARSPRTFAGPEGVIYDVHGDRLDMRQHTGGDRLASWSTQGKPLSLPGDWEDQRWLMAVEDGVLYNIDNARGDVPVRAEQLSWRRTQDNSQVKPIARSFTIEPLAALQGYVSRLSAKPGEKLDLSVSTGHSEYSVTIVRIASATQPLETVSPAVELPGRIQPLPASYREDGCGWATDHQIVIDPKWQSGLYAARLQARGTWRFDIPFAVNPAGRKAPIAFLWPTNTYNAYNDWGGHNQYTPGRQGKQRKLSFLRPSAFNSIDGRADRRINGDLILLRWMSQEKIPFDCYHDGDLAATADWLWGYRAIVLAMHPEYWSEEMRGRLLTYLSHGGCIIYLGGNGIYERVQFNADRTALTFRNVAGERDLYRKLRKPEHDLISVGYHYQSHGTNGPYKVVRDHPLLQGTGLRPGDTFGRTGLLGGASGWEVDRRDGLGSAKADQVIAEGQNTGGGAEMIFRPDAGGGWVFSAGSITFTAAIPADEAVRRLLRNVFDLALKG